MQQQASPPQRRPATITVGDTVTVVQRVALPSGALVQPRAPEDTLLATLVGVPDVSRDGDSVRIAYPLALWAPGTNELIIPGAVVLRSDGSVDTLADARVRLQVASVLPVDSATDSLLPQGASQWVLRSERSPLPFLVLMLPLLLLLTALGIWWRRRGKPMPPTVINTPSRDASLARLSRWIDAGEPLLAIDHLMAILPESEPVNEWRDTVEALRFKPGDNPELMELARAGIELAQRG